MNVSQTTAVPDIVYAFAASPNFARDRTIFAARNSGLYRSDNGGLTWESSYDALNLVDPLTTMAVAVSPNFAADQTVFAGVPGGILRSVDRGQSWQVIQLPEPAPVISTLACSPNFMQDNTIVSGTLEDGVFLSTDGGNHWQVWNFGLFDPHILCLALSPNFANDQTLFAGTEIGLFVSTNAGKSWREVTFSADSTPVLSLAISPRYAADRTLFVGTDARGLFSSDDRGLSWTCFDQIPVNCTVNAITLSSAFPAKPYILLLLADKLLISYNGGQSWSELQNNLNLTQGATSVALPQGLETEAPLLAGLVEDGIVVDNLVLRASAEKIVEAKKCQSTTIGNPR
jgi:photosystem II stability/assembly factor-like uncharacterized protein